MWRRALGAGLGAALAAASFASAFTFAAVTPTAAAAGANETRGGFVAQVGQALCLVAESGAAQKFSDVPPSDPDFGYIMAASQEGWLSGYPNGTFQPEGTLTREQMAKVEVIALGLGSEAAALQNQKPNYSDADTIGRWAWGYVNEASAIGILQGFTDGAFGPNETFTTAQATDALAELTAYVSAHQGPAVAGVTPGSGALGATVSVSGSGFCGATGVAFGTGAATSYTVNSWSSLTATAPSGSGTVDLVVTTPKGMSAKGSQDLFAYTGPAGGGAPAPTPTGGGAPTVVTYSVTSVSSPSAITVTAGTPLNAVSLPATVQATLSNGTQLGMDVTWNGGSPAYNGDQAGTYDFSGTLTLPAGVTNPGGVTASQSVTVQAGPPAAGNSTLTAVYATVTAGPGDLNLTAQIEDQYGNPVSGLTPAQFSFSSSDANASLTPVSVMATTPGTYQIVLTDEDANGGAPQTITATVDGVAPSTGVTVQAAAPYSMAVAPQGVVDIAAGVPETVTFSVEDMYGNPVPGAEIDLAANPTLQGADLTSGPVYTGANGEASAVYEDTQAGDSGTVQGTVYGTSVTGASGTLTIVAQQPPAQADSSVQPASQTVVAGGGNVSLTVVLGDVYGNPVSGLGTAAFQVVSSDAMAGSSGSLAPSVVESPQGTYTLTMTDTDTNGGAPQTLSVSVLGVPIGTSQLTVEPAAPAMISVVSPTSPTDVTAGHGQDVTFEVEDTYHNPVPGVQVDFAATSSLKSAGLSVPNARTGGTGQATVTYTDMTAGDAGQVLGTIDTTPIAASSPTLTILAETTANTGHSSLSATTPVQAAPQDVTLMAQVGDAYGNPITDLVPADFAVTSSALGSITPDSIQQTSTPGTYQIVLTDEDANGGAAQTFTVSVNGVALPTAQVTVTPAAAAQISVVSPAGSTNVTAGKNQTVTFAVTDQYGNPVPGETVDFSVNGSLDSKGLSVISGKTNSSGKVSVVYNDTQGGDMGDLIGTDGALTASVQLTVVAGKVSAGESSVSPATQTVQAATGDVLLSVTAEDASGNPVDGLTAKDFKVTSDDAAVGTLQIVSATESTPGHYAVSLTDTDVNSGNPQTLSTTAAGASLNTVEVTVTAAAPQTIAIVSPTSATQVTAGTPEDVTFLVQDQYGNPVPAALVEFTAQGTLSPSDLTSSVKTGADGQAMAVYTDTVEGDSGMVQGTLYGTSTSAESGTLTIAAAAPVKADSKVKPASQTVTAGPGDVSLTIKVADKYGNEISGLGVTDFQITSSDPKVGTMTPDSVTETATPGTYTVVLTDEDAQNGAPQTLQTAVDGVALNSVMATVNPAAPSIITETSPKGDQTVPAGTSVAVDFTVTDAYGNPTQDVQVDFTSTLPQPDASYAPNMMTDTSGELTEFVVDGTAGDTGTLTGTIDGTSISASSPAITIIPAGVYAAHSSVAPATQTDVAGSNNVKLTVQVADEYNNPINSLSKTDFTVDDPSATLESVMKTAAGTYTLKLTDTTAGTQNVTVSVDSVALNPVSVTITAASAASITLGAPLNPKSIPAGGSQGVSFLVKDQYGNPVDGQQVDFTTDPNGLAGDLSVPNAKTGPNGYANVSFQGDTHAGDTVTVTGQIDGQPSETATSAQITVIAGPAYQGTVTPAHQTVKAGPGDVTLTIAVEDQYGNPVTGLDGTDFTIASDDAKVGTMTPTVVEGPLGTYTATLTDEDADSGSHQTISTTVDTVSLNTVKVKVKPGDPAQVSPELPLTSVTLEPGHSADATFLVTDAYGNPLPNVHVDFAIANPSNFGSGTIPAGDLNSSSGQTAGDGTVRVTLTVPSYGAGGATQLDDYGVVTCTVHNTSITGTSVYFAIHVVP